MTEHILLGMDLETHLIEDWLKAPKVICGGISIKDTDYERLSPRLKEELSKLYREDRPNVVVHLFLASDLAPLLDAIISDEQTKIIGHNFAYDLACMAAYDADNLDRIFSLLQSKRIECTFIRTLIAFNAAGVLKEYQHKKVQLAHGKFSSSSYVGACKIFCDLDLSEDKDKEVQTSYSRVEGLPVADWDVSYRVYLVQDVEYLHHLYHGQNKEDVRYKFIPEKILKADIYKEATRRTAIAFTLQLATCWGIRVDLSAARQLSAKIEEELNEAKAMMVAAGFGEFHKKSGTFKESKKAVQEKLLELDTAFYTEKGNISTKAKHLKECGDKVLEHWAKVSAKKTLSSTFLPILTGLKRPWVNPQFWPYLETGRVSGYSPNLLNPPRSGGFRECFVAREGCVFVMADYDANEMRTLAQTLLDMLGFSVLASKYQEDPDFDPHTYLASRYLSVDYEEGLRLKNEDSHFKSTRQMMKPANFGLPSGMSSRSFVSFAEGYGVTISVAKADELKSFFHRQYPEMKRYHKELSRLTRSGTATGYVARANRVSGERKFTQLGNLYFQGLAAEGGLIAFTEVSRRCYSVPDSKLYGSRPLLFLHDEIVLESPECRAAGAAAELKEVMESVMQMFTVDIPSRATPTISYRWRKGADPKYNEDGVLIPSDTKGL